MVWGQTSANYSVVPTLPVQRSRTIASFCLLGSPVVISKAEILNEMGPLITFHPHRCSCKRVLILLKIISRSHMSGGQDAVAFLTWVFKYLEYMEKNINSLAFKSLELVSIFCTYIKIRTVFDFFIERNKMLVQGYVSWVKVGELKCCQVHHAQWTQGMLKHCSVVDPVVASVSTTCP